MYPYNKQFVGTARSLRKNMTSEEKHLWYDFLKKLPVPVKRQKNIEIYIVDFYISSKKTVIEIDGVQHSMPDNKEADSVRDKKLESLGLSVLRYTNEDINKRFSTVCDDILVHLEISPDQIVKTREEE